ncbi:DUF3304 domain-containing protein [Pseudoduganella sp. SL102]|uniref:DUF3304 domain-containing protein n=1 Tax=Pseudoduganella sp. SL102 TaxID=2995154 RepID=UPI00248CBB9B|nr:DUF3304 domain-containing protein [Pseudoduganella sp. SL102]WBS04830.1 DUF3304 domain-containing protein [Pseudoduganella sp. SL102]
MKYLILLAAATCLSACAAAPPEGPEEYGATIGIVNHTDKYIYATEVGTSGGGHAARYSAGIANVCCVVVPVKWHAGLRMNVQWDMPEGSEHVWKEKMVEVKKYDEPGSVYLHFFDNDEIRIVVTDWIGGAPEHPIPPPVKPLVNDPPMRYDSAGKNKSSLALSAATQGSVPKR